MIREIAHLGLLDEDMIELDVAALEIAALDHPDVDLADYLDRLGEITESLSILAPSVDGPTAQAEALAKVIGAEHDFTGDSDTYDDPANADLISVLDRRRGMPVALSILYVAIAERVGWSAYALNTPGHVLVSVVEDDEVVLIDPFNRGRFVDVEQLAALLSGVLGRGTMPSSEHLAPMSNRAVLVRLLMNQATRAEQAGQSARALTIYRRITTIAPSHSHGWWERARLELVEGDFKGARASLGSMLETTRDPNLRTHVNAALDALGGEGGALDPH